LFSKGLTSKKHPTKQLRQNDIELWRNTGQNNSMDNLNEKKDDPSHPFQNKPNLTL
jgi:hypothetical protein